MWRREEEWVDKQAKTERRDVRISQDGTRDWVTHRRVASRESALKKPATLETETMYGQGQCMTSKNREWREDLK